MVAYGDVVQGSAEIIDWAEARTTEAARQLTPSDGHGACQEIEKRLDEIAGVHVRRYYYSAALFDEPEAVRKMYANDVSFLRGLLVSGTWGVVRKEMIKVMDLGPEQGLESKGIIEGELSWIDDLLSDGRQYLVGDRFSRADLTAASLLAPLVIPKEHPVYPNLTLPPRFTSDLEGWKDRPSIEWVREMYGQFRNVS